MNQATKRTIEASTQPTWVLYDNLQKKEVLAKEYYAKMKLSEGGRYKFIKKM